MSNEASELIRVTRVLQDVVGVDQIVHSLRDSHRQFERLLHALAALIRSCRILDEFLKRDVR